MNSKEKYYKFIMNDLLSKTIMEPFVYDFTPFWIKREHSLPLGNIVDRATGLPRNPEAPYYVGDYMVEKYGTSVEDVEHLWGLYTWIVLTTIVPGVYDK